ncbi:hypothetical protein BU16DRAFT_617031 [Lophium mytilinum]|uniref:Oxidase ustYa n=1 Tax=Lophium mytilinum TaxID=390894 RepID=A0A6A6QXR5_9PEZI|nr:hypothetical protein BU16DRAFT_617031 [Lophium mytilinum]
MRMPLTGPIYSKYDSLSERELHHELRRNPNATLIILLIVTAVVASTLGFYAGRNSIKATDEGLLLPPGKVHQVWHHNETFSQKPTPQSEAAWNSLAPIGRGFVYHPVVSPIVSGITVFHQLHCVHGLRLAYYIITHQLESLNGSHTNDTFLNTIAARTNIGHIRHCFDYLRQSIMCAADTNFETVDQEHHTVNGWGSERQCRDYGEVVRWAELWRNDSSSGIL